MKNKLKQTAWMQFIQTWLQTVAKPYYQSLAVREQNSLCFAAVFLPIIMVVFVIILPLHDAKQQRQGDLQALQQQALKAEDLAEVLQKKGPVNAVRSTMAVVDAAAKNVKIQQFITRMRPQLGGIKGKQRLLIQMRSAPYSKVVIFLQHLSEQGLSLLSAKIQQDKQLGLVHLQAVVE
ncbi:MAG: type II secretion system protein M [Mariprofundaceae bacterium]|nr:type II secretion system protein M [Mariprofundaceae bacterium]